jgi:cytochrome P450
MNTAPNETSRQRGRRLSMYRLALRPDAETAKKLFTELAAKDPIHWDPYTSSWLVADYNAARKVLTDPVFSSQHDRLVHPDVFSGQNPSSRDTYIQDVLRRQLLFMDGPKHARLRPLIARALSASRVRRLAPLITALSDSACEGKDGRIDVVRDVARPVPLKVVAELLGLEPVGRDLLRRFSDAYTKVITGVDRTIDDNTLNVLAEFVEYALGVIHDKRWHPGDDTVSELVRDADRIGGFDDLDLAANLVMLVAAGHQTTTGLIAGTVAEWMSPSRDIDTQTRLDVDRVLATISPSRFIGRTALADTVLDGHAIRAGQTVLVLLAAVNWSTVDGHSAHLAFGAGAHRCPGALLARLEGQIVLDRLHRRWSAATMDTPEIQWSRNFNLPCPTALPLTLPHGN